MFAKVMVVIDPEANHQIALDKALQLARSDDFELILLSCEHSQYLAEGYYFDAVVLESLRGEYIAQRLSSLEEIAEPLRENGLNVSTSAIWSYPSHKGIIAEAEQNSVDLIIHHVERHGAFSRVLLTHNDWQLVRYAPAPILLVKDTPWKRAPTIIAAVDPQHARHKPSGLDHKILDVSESLSQLLSGQLYALHAYHPLPFSGEYPLDAKQIHQAAFSGLMKDFSVPQDHQLLIEEQPVVALQQTEKALDADIIAMGSISRSLVSDLFIGSTTEQVVDFVNCDILALKPS